MADAEPQDHPEIPPDHIHTRFKGKMIRAAEPIAEGASLTIDSEGWVRTATVEQMEELFPDEQHWHQMAKQHGLTCKYTRDKDGVTVVITGKRGEVTKVYPNWWFLETDCADFAVTVLMSRMAAEIG